MKLERAQALHAPYERSEIRHGHANGLSPRPWGPAWAPSPSRFPRPAASTSIPEPRTGVRTERALKLAVAEMYVQGVSTRKVTPGHRGVVRPGGQQRSGQPGRATLDADSASGNGPLGRSPTLSSMPATRRSVTAAPSSPVPSWSPSASTPACAILGVSVSLSEAEAHWREFLASLQDRGLHGVKLIASDDHAGLKEARQARFSGVPWQRCQFHLTQNALDYVPKLAMRKEVGAGLRAVLDAPDGAEAQRLLELAVAKYRRRHRGWPRGWRPTSPSPDRLRTCRRPPEAAKDDQPAGADQQGDQATDAGRHPLPQRGVALQTGQRRVGGDRRRVGDERNYVKMESD